LPHIGLSLPKTWPLASHNKRPKRWRWKLSVISVTCAISLDPIGQPLFSRSGTTQNVTTTVTSEVAGDSVRLKSHKVQVSLGSFVYDTLSYLSKLGLKCPWLVTANPGGSWGSTLLCAHCPAHLRLLQCHLLPLSLSFDVCW
jgi:hypothetical protein